MLKITGITKIICESECAFSFVIDNNSDFFTQSFFLQMYRYQLLSGTVSKHNCLAYGLCAIIIIISFLLFQTYISQHQVAMIAKGLTKYDSIKNSCNSTSHFVFDVIGHKMESFIEQNDLIVYPWALTMISALRFGGNDIGCDGDICVADHDVDFLIISDIVEFHEIVQKFYRFLKDELSASVILLMNFSHSFIVIIGPRTQITAEKTYFIKKRLDESNSSSISMHLLKFVFNYFTNTIIRLSEYVTVIDFWSIHNIAVKYNIDDLKPHPQRKVLWQHSSFSLPKNIELIQSSLHNVVKNQHGLIYDWNSTCDIYNPLIIHWPEDDVYQNHTNITQTLHKCTSKLQESDFFSFKNICDNYSS